MSEEKEEEQEIDLSEEQEVDLTSPNAGGGSKDEIKQKFQASKNELEISEEASQVDVLDAVLSARDDEIMPWEPCFLPSQGLYYSGKIPKGELKVRAWGIYTDKILATQRLVQSGHAMDYLFKHCVKFPSTDFDPGDLIAGDRIFLLYYLRGITHGPNYEFIAKCSNEDCENSFTDSYDLNLLADTIKRPKILEPEPFKVNLPHLSKITKRQFFVKVKLLRGRDAQAIMSKQKFDKKIGGGSAKTFAAKNISEVTLDQSTEENLNLVIVEAMGNRDEFKIKKLVSRMHASDTATIRQFLNDNSPGIDTKVKMRCPECKTEMVMDLPITESFFRPTESGRLRE